MADVLMESKVNPSYWAGLLKDLRRNLNVTQVELARLLDIDQATVSRWERGLTEPHYEFRRTLDRMAREQGLALIDDVATIVRLSPFPMILLDRQDRVIAASKCSGFRADMTTREQTPPEERGQLREFGEALAGKGFWERRCLSMEYEARVGDEVRRALVIAISMRGEVFALVQKAW